METVFRRLVFATFGMVTVSIVDSGACSRSSEASPPMSADSAIVQANRDFAANLYRQLAQENHGKNLSSLPIRCTMPWR